MRNITSSLLLLAACSSPPPEEVRYEGDDAGECSDGADNDRDGGFDCDDSDCALSPDCSDEADTDTDTDTDSDTDTDTDTDTDVDLPYRGVVVDYTLYWDFDTIWEQSYGFADCALVFSASADADSAEAGVGAYTFWGTWRLLSDDCPEKLGLASVVWHAPEGMAYTTLHLTGGGGVLDAWVVHEAQSERAAAASSDESGKFYIFQMGAPLQGGEAHHTESEEVYESGFLLATLTHDLRVQVAEE